MKNHTPDLSAYVNAELIRNPTDRFPLWSVKSDPVLSASSVAPRPILESNVQLGTIPSSMWEDEELSKDWYVCRKLNTPHLMDMAPPLNAHIAANLVARREVVEGFVLEHHANGQSAKYFLEIVRPNTKSEAELRPHINHIAMGDLELTSLQLAKSKANDVVLEGTLIENCLFIVRPEEEVIGWQFIYNHGGMAKPIRSEPTRLVFQVNQKSMKTVEDYSFIEDRRGTIFHSSFRKETSKTRPAGHVVNATITDTDENHRGSTTLKTDLATSALMATFQQQIQQYASSGGQVEFYVTDSHSAIFLANALDSCFENPLFWMKPPKVHYVPTWSGLYELPNKEMKYDSIARVQFLWKQMGFDRYFKEAKVQGTAFREASKRHDANRKK